MINSKVTQQQIGGSSKPKPQINYATTTGNVGQGGTQPHSTTNQKSHVMNIGVSASQKQLSTNNVLLGSKQHQLGTGNPTTQGALIKTG